MPPFASHPKIKPIPVHPSRLDKGTQNLVDMVQKNIYYIDHKAFPSLARNLKVRNPKSYSFSTKRHLLKNSRNLIQHTLAVEAKVKNHLPIAKKRLFHSASNFSTTNTLFCTFFSTLLRVLTEKCKNVFRNTDYQVLI